MSDSSAALSIDDAAPGEGASEAPSLDAEPAQAVAAVPPGQAESAVRIDAARAAQLDAKVAEYVDGVTTLDVHDAAFAARVRDIDTLGSVDIRAAAEVSNRLLGKPLAAARRGGMAESSDVSQSLVKLRRTVEDLDPSTQGNLLAPRRILGILPFGNRLRDYFSRYRSSQALLNSIIQALLRGQAELEKDNRDIEQEKANLWAVMARLRQYVYLGEHVDAALAAKIAEIEQTDSERASALRQDILFPVRQKVQDLLTQLAVSVQGYLALDLVRRNNGELIKGVDRATTTTVSALRTAIIVAQALSDQRLVLDQITALNATTGRLIESTAEMLSQQSAAINEQASNATIELATLQTAFAKIYATIDDVDTFKVKALDSMSKTIDALTVEISKSQASLERAGAREGGDASTPA